MHAFEHFVETDGEDSSEELASENKLSSLFNSVLQLKEVSLITSKTDYSESLEFSSDEESEEKSNLETTSTLSNTNCSSSDGLELNDQEKTPFTQVIEFEEDAEQIEKPFEIQILPGHSSYFRYKVSEYTIFQKYVYESREQLEVIGNKDVVENIILMLDGMQKKLQSTNTRQQISSANRLQLTQFLDHLDKYIEYHTLMNSRRAIKRLLGVVKFAESTKIADLAKMPELYALEYYVRNNESHLNCLEDRNTGLTLLKLLQKAHNRINIAKKRNLLDVKAFHALVWYTKDLAIEICLISLNNTKKILVQKEDEFVSLVHNLHTISDKWKWAKAILELFEKSNGLIGLVHSGTEAIRDACLNLCEWSAGEDVSTNGASQNKELNVEDISQAVKQVRAIATQLQSKIQTQILQAVSVNILSTWFSDELGKIDGTPYRRKITRQLFKTLFDECNSSSSQIALQLKTFLSGTLESKANDHDSKECVSLHLYMSSKS